jgi:hypothetical protein
MYFAPGNKKRDYQNYRGKNNRNQIGPPITGKIDKRDVFSYLLRKDIGTGRLNTRKKAQWKQKALEAIGGEKT